MDDRQQRGLSAEEVVDRVRRGLTNAVRETTSRSYGDILRENVFTLFNLILVVLVVAVLLVGSPRDALFGLVVVFNSAVGVVQEIRAKRTLDRLQLLSAPRARVLREGETREIPLAEVVRDDVVLLQGGDQIAADGTVLASDGLEIDESLLTGESVPVLKQPGDGVLSGTFVIAGAGSIRATSVGEEAYARRLSAEAKRFRLVRSELREGVNRILKLVLWLMLPIGLLTVATQVERHASVQSATLSTAAALEAMVPQGLVLLTSIAFAYSVILLGRRQVLVQELAAVEVLARVDVVCIDKTGTLTEAALEVERLEPLAEGQPAEAALGALASLEGNRTAEALGARYARPDGWEARGHVAFSSGRKWSGATFGERGTWVLGAPEVLLPGGHDDAAAKAAAIAADGSRVLLLASTAEELAPDRPPASLAPAALVVLAERVRPDAAGALRYLADQGVAVKVLSGDSPATVAAVAARVGLEAREPVDSRTLPADAAELVALVDAHTVFGRISPQDKRRIVEALRAAGHVVAMTGDGVNDVPALKAADLGIAMGSGARAARAVGQVVLLDARFAVLPRVMAEGRRVIANIERVANLFLAKTTYAVFLALATAAAAVPFPFLPRHLTIVASLTIGIPSFFLALAPNPARYTPGFLQRVLRFALPAGSGAAVAAFAAYLGVRAGGVPLAEARTAATLALTLVGLWILGSLSRPLTGWRLWLVVSMALGLALVVTVPFARSFFALAVLLPRELGLAAASALGGVALVELGLRLAGWRRAQ
ncbi:MAG TPA: HAD-IC family P-type ATPase [Coriobacteriia bacterium]|jgi:cation-transporting ATPase E